VTNEACDPAEPTPEQCSACSPVERPKGWGEEWKFFAIWYPQMGGYVGKAVIAICGNGCFEAFIWHDGSFPFNGDSFPAHIHHCMARQFIEFGEDIIKLQEGE